MTERARTNNDLTTPPEVLDQVRQMGPIALDPCSNPWSTVGAVVELHGCGVDDDGIEARWTEIVSHAPGLVFVNPPYGRGHLMRWASKIAVEAAAGCEILALVPASPDTKWWDVMRRQADALCYWRGRIAFGGGECGSGTFPSALFYFGRRRFLFCHVFDGVGDVRVLA